MRAGMKVPIMANWQARNWFLVAVEMTSPNPRATIRNRAETASSRVREPRMGMPKTKAAKSMEIARLTMPSRKLVAALAARISPLPTGVTKRLSSVPRSYSRAMTREVRSAPIMVMMVTMTPGTR